MVMPIEQPPPLESRPSPAPRWINLLIWVGAGAFILALALSAVYDPRIRILHALQGLIYVAVIALVRQNNPWGFGAGFLIAGFWNYTNLFVTTFVKAGVGQLVLLMQTGHVERPDMMVALAAAGGHFLLMGGCLPGFLRTRPAARQWGEFLGGGIAAVAYLVLIIITTGPQYIPLLKRVFRLA